MLIPWLHSLFLGVIQCNCPDIPGKAARDHLVTQGFFSLPFAQHVLAFLEVNP
jgi:hypothetical protein